MNKEFKDPHIGGYFAVKHVDQVLELGKSDQFQHYGVLISLDTHIELKKDGVPLDLGPGKIACLSPGCTLELVSYRSGEHYFVLFNTEFYCVELHDKETSCNGTGYPQKTRNEQGRAQAET